MSDGDMPRRRREPVFNVPGVILALCAVFLVVHAIRDLLPVATDESVFDALALLPVRFAVALGLEPAGFSAEFVATAGGARWWTLLTSALLHGSWTHVGLNCLWFVAFGAAVARRLGPVRLLALFTVSAVVGNLVYVAFNLTSFAFVIGASGGVSGMVGAITRFVFRPSDEAIGALDLAAFRRPLLSLRQVLTTKAPLIFIVVFLVTNVLAGFVPAVAGLGDAPVAWQAHVGGFLAGLLLLPLFEPRLPNPAAPIDDTIF